MKLIIFGGTTEGRELSERMAAAGALVTVCVATEYGGETQPSGENLAVRGSGHTLPPPAPPRERGG